MLEFGGAYTRYMPRKCLGSRVSMGFTVSRDQDEAATDEHEAQQMEQFKRVLVFHPNSISQMSGLV
jgi:hypothetical protein